MSCRKNLYLYAIMPIYIQNKTKEKEKNFLCRKPGPLINKTKKRKPIPSLSGLSIMDLSIVNLDAPHSMGTTIIGVTYNGGVVLGADSRTSTGFFFFFFLLCLATDFLTIILTHCF